ncbi:hypothetical protein QFZ82_004356 [Streptomyces sp. V4I23]|uniref:contact-dependent growth inhibition system immunity protein n=1 Tax=Streptomyces sp. V4I23 TaxID=3042282 RepID=UPI00278749CC|nr:contact-dependent growth inhibition system immunity protein [Streptomyces sp. V4I23]MDQ1009871.1 hypothetical protein [Streptomyces sp. V4I23]
MTRDVSRTLSLENLEGDEWPEPPAGSTGLVRTVHALRKRPIGELSAYELSRMIGQEVGLPWLMPVALEILSETAPAQAGGGFYDEELLSAVLTRSSEVWRTSPQWAEEVSGILHQLVDLSPYIQSDVKEFLDNTRNI